MIRHTICLLTSLTVWSQAQTLPLPQWPAGLSADRRVVLERAMDFLKANPAVPYLTGGADAKGMDCSGAVIFMLKAANIEPPRSAHGQYEWLKKQDRLTIVPDTARTQDAPVFRTIQPGDLVFWAHDGPDAPIEIHISHVHMFLGLEKDGHAVMIGSSDGRSYRGKVVHGFGIVDGHVPKVGSTTRIVAFGSPFPTPKPTTTGSEETGTEKSKEPSPTKKTP
jgi:cell wall-associated NlpC family hydrolase